VSRELAAFFGVLVGSDLCALGTAAYNDCRGRMGGFRILYFFSPHRCVLAAGFLYQLAGAARDAMLRRRGSHIDSSGAHGFTPPFAVEAGLRGFRRRNAQVL